MDDVNKSMASLQLAIETRIHNEITFIQKVSDSIKATIDEINTIIEPILDRSDKLDDIKERLNGFTQMLQTYPVIHSLSDPSIDTSLTTLNKLGFDENSGGKRTKKNKKIKTRPN